MSKPKAKPPVVVIKPLSADDIFAAIMALRIERPSEFTTLIDRLATAGVVRVAQGFLQ